MGSVPIFFGDPEDDFDDDEEPEPEDGGDGKTDDEGEEVFPISDPEQD